MKEIRNLLIGIILGGLIGWALGFLRLPYIEKNFSFLMGFIACFAFAALGIILLFVLNRNFLPLRLIGNDASSSVTKKATLARALILILVAASIVYGGIKSFLIFKQNSTLKAKIQYRDDKIREISGVIESDMKSGLIALMSSVLDKVDDELKNNPKRTLSDETIARITATVNYSFKPYRHWAGDSLSQNELSPERGQLLITLSAMNIDSGSYNKIISQASFSGADLRGADLRGFDLSGAELKGADLQDTDLSGADLSGADLKETNLWGANLNNANLNEADLRRSNLSWAELNGIKLRLANLDGADLTNAQLRRADLSGATLQWAKAGGVMLNEANLTGVDLKGTVLARANLSEASLIEANLGKVNLNEAILAGAKLAKTSVETEDWLEKLNEWRIAGAGEIQAGYRIADDTARRYKESQYCLERIED